VGGGGNVKGKSGHTKGGGSNGMRDRREKAGKEIAP